jgi:hypothetical protein
VKNLKARLRAKRIRLRKRITLIRWLLDGNLVGYTFEYDHGRDRGGRITLVVDELHQPTTHLGGIW